MVDGDWHKAFDVKTGDWRCCAFGPGGLHHSGDGPAPRHHVEIPSQENGCLEGGKIWQQSSKLGRLAVGPWPVQMQGNGSNAALWQGERLERGP